MIKTIITTKVEELDKAVNDFMSMRGQNLPVRTEVFVIQNNDTYTVYHKATIFFDEFLGTKKSDDSKIIDEAEETATTPKKTGGKIGSLWKQTNGSISGMFKEEKLRIPPLITDKLTEEGRWTGTIKKEKVRIIPNKFKKIEKHPDYVILQGGEQQ
jgi:uncharacterized protein (DUF736 family)